VMQCGLLEKELLPCEPSTQFYRAHP
jgi:hypothetical protein